MVIERELVEYDEWLVLLLWILVFLKVDLVLLEVVVEVVVEWVECVEFFVFVILLVIGVGLVELCNELFVRVLVVEPVGAGEDEVVEFVVFWLVALCVFEILCADDGGWVVTGDAVEWLIVCYDMENEEVQVLVEWCLYWMGVIVVLAWVGFEFGDDVEIGGMVFELDLSVLF